MTDYDFVSYMAQDSKTQPGEGLISQEDYLALLETIVPDLENEHLLNYFDNFKTLTQSLDKTAEKKIRLLNGVLNFRSRLKHGKRYRDLKISKREDFFKIMNESSIQKIAAGFNGLRSLVLMSVYTDQTAWSHIGYKGPLVKQK